MGKSQLTQIQSDFTDELEVFDKKHNLITGVDLSVEQAKRNNSAAGAQVYGSTFTTLVGTPNDGESLPDNRDIKLNSFKTQNIGIYAQNTMSINESWKVLAGLRFDHIEGEYTSHTCPSPSTQKVKDDLWSPRIGVMFQPSPNASYYASAGTSYNTSGDTYAHGINICVTPGSNNEKLVNTPPEKSRNIEIGGKFELFEDSTSLGVAVFRSEKYNERNTDEPTVDSYLLSGKRHATGMEFNLSGRITPKWDVFYNHTWIPEAKIDNGATTGNGQREGDRPSLTPEHSASLWTTYRVTNQWRVGGGLNYRDKQNPEGNRSVQAKAFTTADAMVEYAVTPATTLKLNVTNLTDELYADSLYRGFYAPGQARKVQLNLKHQF